MYHFAEIGKIALASTVKEIGIKTALSIAIRSKANGISEKMLLKGR